jgi:hypothetical protein
MVMRARLAQPDGTVAEKRRGARRGTILIAAGTQPNTVLAREDRAHFPLDGRYFQAIDDDGNPVRPSARRSRAARVLMRADGEDRYTSFFGDLHPSFSATS